MIKAVLFIMLLALQTAPTGGPALDSPPVFIGRCSYQPPHDKYEKQIPCNGLSISAGPGNRVIVNFMLVGGREIVTFSGPSDLESSNGEVQVDAVQLRPGVRTSADGKCKILTKENMLVGAVCAASVGQFTYVGQFDVGAR